MANVLPLSERNMILTGYTGPNQPLIGIQIAERLRMPFVNIELQVEERSGFTVDELQTYYGETRLKTVETQILEETILRRNTVIRVSGRTLLSGSHLKNLQETGPVICLVASLDAILQRLHLAMGARYHSPYERAMVLGHLKSEWAVRSKSGVHELDVTYMNEAETIEAVIAMWQQLAIRRG